MFGIIWSPASPMFWRAVMYEIILTHPVIAPLKTAVIGLLTVSAGIYLAFIAWRAFKTATNKV